MNKNSKKTKNKINSVKNLIKISAGFLILFLSATGVYAFAKEFGDTCAGISAGSRHTCVLKSNGNVDCYGWNNYGQIVDYTGGDAIGVSDGEDYACILKSNRNVDCYGNNGNGQAADYTGGDAVGVATGGYHTCVLKSDGNVDCYGYNAAGQAADYTGGDATGVSTGYMHTCVLKSDGNVDCYGYNAAGQAADYTGGDATGVSAGYRHTCVLKSNGNVDCYGDNSYGQANDYTGGDATGVSAGYWHTCVLKSNGNVDCYGDNFYGLANDYTGGDATGVSAGYYHTCVLKSDSNVDCLGWNFYGQANDYAGGDAVCSRYYCGDGITQAGLGEQCDDGANGDNTDGCYDNCTLTYCGDSILQNPNGNNFQEQCDDGNNVDGDGCSSDCKIRNIGNTQFNLIDPLLGAGICVGKATKITSNITINVSNPNDALLRNVSVCINLACAGGYNVNEKHYVNLTRTLQANVTLNIAPTAVGQCNVTTCVDCDNTIPEINETDNCENTAFNVTSCSQPEHSVPALTPLEILILFGALLAIGVMQIKKKT